VSRNFLVTELHTYSGPETRSLGCFYEFCNVLFFGYWEDGNTWVTMAVSIENECNKHRLNMI
jgi:hypothetical protein